MSLELQDNNPKPPMRDLTQKKLAATVLLEKQRHEQKLSKILCVGVAPSLERLVEDEEVKEVYREFAHTSFVPPKAYFADERLFVSSRKTFLDLQKSHLFTVHDQEDLLFIGTNYHFKTFQFLKSELGVDVALRWDPMMKKMEAVIFYGADTCQKYHMNLDEKGPLCAEIADLARRYGLECYFTAAGGDHESE